MRTEPAAEVQLVSDGGLHDFAFVVLGAMEPAGLSVVLTRERIEHLTGGVGGERGGAEFGDLGGVGDHAIGVDLDHGTGGGAVGESLIRVGVAAFAGRGKIQVEIFAQFVIDGDGEDLARDAFATTGAVDVAAGSEESRIDGLAVRPAHGGARGEMVSGVDNVRLSAVLHHDGSDAGAGDGQADGRGESGAGGGGE